MKKRKLGIIIGRFQVPELHEGHKHLIESVIRENDDVLILVGTSRTDGNNERNPFSYAERRDIIHKSYNFRTLSVKILLDRETNWEWSQSIDKLQKRYPDCKITLYGSRDSFRKDYLGILPYKHVEEIPDVSGTKVREEMKNGKK